MYNKEEIEDSLEFCRGISFYETGTFSIPLDEEDNGDLAIEEPLEEIESIIEDVEEEPFLKLVLWRVSEAIICVALAFIIATLMNTYIGTHTRVDGNSMESTLQDKDFLLIDKFSYLIGEPKRYDIIVFQHDEENNYIKRVIGLPGETVQIIDGTVFINGSILNDKFGSEKINDSGLAQDAITLGEDEYFVLGDNRNHSNDSRFAVVGNINKSLIEGKAVYRILPLEKFGKIE